MFTVRPRLQSITSRLVLYALLCTVPLVVFGLVQLREEVTHLRNDALADATATLKRMQWRMNSQLAAAEVASQLAGALRPSARRDGPACDTALKRAIDAAPFARNFSLADRDGRLVCSSLTVSLGMSVAQRPLYREAIRLQRPVLGDFVRSIVDERPSLVFAVPITGSGEPVPLVAITVFDTPALTSDLAHDEQLVVALLDRRGVLVSRSNDSPLVRVGHASSTEGQFERVRSATAPVRMQWLDTRERLYVSSPIVYHGETVMWAAAGVDAETIEGRALGHVAEQLPIVLVVGAAVILVSLFATRPVVLARMRGLLVAAHDVIQGRSGSRVRIQVDDELAEVERAFNQMLDAVEADRRRAQQLQRDLERRVDERTHELALANEELRSFSSTVSHDLRAPVAVVRSFSQVLLEKSPMDGQDRHYLERIQAAGEHMNELIAALLHLARLGQAKLERGPVDLSALTRTVAQECRDATGRDVDVRVGPGGAVLGDEALLRVVVSNLLANAWKFTRDATQPRVEVAFERSGKECVVTVRDNGAGFDEAYASRLFQPFQRLHTAGEFPGLGIGLATVHRIVARHGGRMWAHGSVGEGAAFHFTLPAAPASEES